MRHCSYWPYLGPTAIIHPEDDCLDLAHTEQRAREQALHGVMLTYAPLDMLENYVFQNSHEQKGCFPE